PMPISLAPLAPFTLFAPSSPPPAPAAAPKSKHLFPLFPPRIAQVPFVYVVTPGNHPTKAKEYE
ncbi:MAG: hypothetical protein ACI81P_002457, partial [Neolewinella sp.]